MLTQTVNWLYAGFLRDQGLFQIGWNILLSCGSDCETMGLSEPQAHDQENGERPFRSFYKSPPNIEQPQLKGYSEGYFFEKQLFRQNRKELWFNVPSRRGFIDIPLM